MNVTTPTLTVLEVARLLRVSRQHVYKCVREGDLPSVRLGGKILIPTKAYEEWLAGK